ncbi:DNA-binding transcriptional regulator OxyR, partial [Vibrio campbellii]|nr:DNA-binding transcriptional regulator OxyR [Vibrio campbellii]
QLSVPHEKKKDGVCYVPAVNPTPSRSIVLVYRPGSPLRARFEALASTIKSILEAKQNSIAA